MQVKQSKPKNDLNTRIPGSQDPPPLTIGEKLIFLIPILAIALPIIGILILKH